MNYSGFPEPFLLNSDKFHRRWQKTHLDIILRQDFLDIYAIRSIKSIEILIDLLRIKIASGVSYSNLSGHLQVDVKTVQNWLYLLENFYILFKITPYHKNITRSLLKEPKYYFFDISRVKDEGARLENLVACALLKEIHFVEDSEGLDLNLHYLKTKDGAEIDFLITLDNEPVICFEVKTSDNNPSKNFDIFRNKIQIPYAFQLVLNLDREYDTNNNISVRDLVKFLSKFNLMKYLY